MMSNKEFLELLNLYIDKEISDEERELLEREIASNESRRAVFNEYVRLQEATEKLFNHFHSNLTESVDLKKYHILSRNSDQRYVLGSLYSAAAVFVACLSIFAATRILSDSAGVSRADRDGDREMADVEVVTNPAATRGSGQLWRISNESYLPPSSSLQSMFAGAPEFSTGFHLRGDETGIHADGRRIFRSGNAFEAPAPDFVSFQFQR